MENNELALAAAKELYNEMLQTIEKLNIAIARKDAQLFNAFRKTSHPIFDKVAPYDLDHAEQVQAAYEQYLLELDKLGTRIVYLG